MVRGQSGLAVIDVADGTDVEVRFVPQGLFVHGISPMSLFILLF